MVCRFFGVCLVIVVVAFRGICGETLPPDWPTPSKFTPGSETRFRLPFFVNMLTYGDEDQPLYNVLYVPRNYDPQKAYPLFVRFPPQGSKPSTEEFTKVTNGQAFVLGVSWFIYMKTRDNSTFRIPTDQEMYAPVIQWVVSNWNIDRRRVFIGGFSAGGFAAGTYGTVPSMRHLVTHFVIMGAGIRESCELKQVAGKYAFIAVGKDDQNYNSAKSAVTKLQTAGCKVTFFEEPGVGHAIGTGMSAALEAWLKTFDPAVHADEWLKSAQTLEKADKSRACDIYARVATIGEGDVKGKTARSKLEELEGPALRAYENALVLLKSRKYTEATKAFRDANSEAQKIRSTRLALLCQLGAEEVLEWQYGEQIAAMEEAHLTRRFYEACLYAEDGVKRYTAALKGWEKPFKDRMAQFYMKKTETAAKDDPAVCADQSKLVSARSAIWSGNAVAAKQALEQIAKKYEGKAEGIEAKHLLQRIGNQ